MALRFLRDGYFVGTVGIGTASPDAKLDVRSTSRTAPVVLKLGNGIISGDNGVIVSQIRSYINNSNTAADELARIQVENGSGSHDDGNLSFWTRDGLNNVDAAKQLQINGKGVVELKKSGTAALPVLVLGEDVDTGFFRPSSNNIALSTTGVERIRVTSGGNVGIGATTGFNAVSGTETTLYIKNTNVASLYLDSTANNGNKWGIYSAAAGQLAFYDFSEASERMRITGTGNVGIGTDSPDAKLDVKETTSDVAGEIIVGGLIASDDVPFGKISFANTATANTQTNDILASIAGEKVGSSNRGELTFSTSDSAAPTEKMRIDSAGNVGIGTDSPDAKLTVKGAATAGLNQTINIETGGVAAEDGGSMSFTLGSFLGSYPNWRIGQIGAVYESTNSFDGALVFKTSTAADGGTEKMRIASDGAIKFNTYGAGTLVTDSSGNITVSSGGGAGGPYLPGQQELLPNTSGTPGWYKLGTLGSFVQGGATAVIEFTGHAGYNASNAQDYYIKLFIKTSNGNGGGAQGQGYNSWYERTGGYVNSTIEFKWDNSATNDYDLYMYVPGHSLRSMYNVTQSSGIWTTTGVTATDPGVDSIDVLKSVGLFNILDTNVGIGTTSPGDALVVKGGSPGNIDLVSFQNNAGNETHRFYADSANDGVISTVTNAGVIANLIQSSGDSYFNGGNVGIGTPTPGYKLDVESSTTPLHLNRTGGATSLIGLDIAGVNRGLIGATTTAAFVSYSSAAASLMTVLNTGNVGINTTSPDFKLDVDGTFGVSDLPFNTDSVSVLVADETLGADLVTNGDFATNSDWTEQGGAAAWSIANGKANCVVNSNTRYFEQPNVLPSSGAGNTYKVVYTISGITQGTFQINVGGYGATPGRNANGTYAETFTTASASSNNRIYLQSNPNTIGSIDNISVQLITSASNQIQKRELGTDAFISNGPYLQLAGGTMAGDILMSEHSVKFDQSGTRSWDISAGSGNLNITSGDSLGNVFLSPGISVEDNAFIGGNITTNGDITIDNASGDPFLKLKTVAQEYVIRIDQSDGEKFQIRNTTASVTALSLDISSNATFAGTVTAADLLTVNGDGHLFLGATGETPKIDMLYTTNASGRGWDTRIFTGKTDDLPNAQSFPTSTIAGGYGTQYQANSDGAFFGIIPYPLATSTHYRPIINWGDDVTDTPFSFQFNGSDIVTINYAGGITAPSFSGDHRGTINTATTAVTKPNTTDDTTVATTAFVKNLIAELPAGLIYKGAWDADTNTPTLAAGGGEISEGTTTTVTADKLIDSAATFTTDGVAVGDRARVENVNGVSYALVTSVDSQTQLTLDANIVVSTTEVYIIETPAFLEEGNYYIVSVDGATDLNGITDWKVGDWVVASSTNEWQKIDNSSVLDGEGTGQTIPLWSGAGNSNTLTNSIITQQSDDQISILGTTATTGQLGQLTIFGYDDGDSNTKYIQTRVDNGGDAYVTASGPYLNLNSANYIKSSSVHIFTEDIFMYNGKYIRYLDATNPVDSWNRTLGVTTSDVVQVGGILGYNAGKGQLELFSNNVQAMYIDENQMVGIGKVPAAQNVLDIQNDNTAGSFTTHRNNTGFVLNRAYADYGNDGTIVEYQERIGVDGNNSSIGNFSNHNLGIRTNNQDRITILAGGNVGINSTSPPSALDVQPTAANRKVTRIANDVMSTYFYNAQVDAILAWTCGSYHQAEVVITANQTNGGTYNNLYIRGIWSNNHTSHHWDELEHVGSLTGSTFTMSVGQNGATTASGRLELDFDYLNGSFSQLNVRVTDFYGSHSYTIT